jgi:peptidoglycan hydrolase CwlO-like protein
MWQLTGVLGIALLVTAGAFKMYADKTEAEKEAMAMDLRQASDNQLVLETSISNLNKQLTEAEQRQQNILDRVNELQAANAQAQKEVESIRKKFAKHDMNVLSLRKPVLIENIINRGTKGVLSDLETITDPSS